MNYSQMHAQAYDGCAKKYEEQTNIFLEKYLLDDAKLFLEYTPGRNILDVGSGPGRDALYFKKQGFKPLCIDISSKMIDLCLEKGLHARIMDFEKLDFEEKSMDGVWAYTSLLHVPKEKLPQTLKNISQILKPKGTFFIGVKEGSEEGIVESERGKRYFSSYEKNELSNYLSKEFNVIHFNKIKSPLSYNLLNFLCLKD